ncbi:multicopper oxidase domain-containing protein [bacterium]|nr:multicopper oxidase domain-containing protein [bacterium]
MSSKFKAIKKLVLILCLAFGYESFGFTVTDTLYINSGKLSLGLQDSLQLTVFGSSENFDGRNTKFKLNPNDILDLIIINLDQHTHKAAIQGLNETWETLNTGDSAHYILTFQDEGIFILEDLLNDKLFSYAGLSTTIAVSKRFSKDFHWNIKDINSEWSEEISNNATAVAAAEYEPDFFLLNELRNPGIDLDSTAKVRGSVGDTLHIYISNTGNAIHSIHLHGYHATLIYSSGNQVRLGWEKDTYGLEPGESIILEIVPDKTGEYPVHDHNLVAVTGGGYYPNGIFTTMVITE